MAKKGYVELLPKKYKKSDIKYILNNLGKKSLNEIADRYEVKVSTFKSHLTMIRKMGYKVPSMDRRNTKHNRNIDTNPIIHKKHPQQEIVRLPNRVVDIKNKKWVRIDRRTLILVDKTMGEESAIQQYYEKRERINCFKH